MLSTIQNTMTVPKEETATECAAAEVAKVANTPAAAEAKTAHETWGALGEAHSKRADAKLEEAKQLAKNAEYAAEQAAAAKQQAGMVLEAREARHAAELDALKAREAAAAEAEARAAKVGSHAGRNIPHRAVRNAAR